ncbi:hypothetical protein HZC32_00840 [Candidatus Woesearchaeota archaeon]|nr:hypothetical protein [Candidatus Woesearchaeota archaeon]
MNDYLLEAREELKRLEHIIYVSLKYTRTTDVIINALTRLLSVFDLIIEAYLEDAKGKGLISALPKSPAFRGTKLSGLYSEDKELQHYLYFYSFLRTLLKLPHQKREEYRRHVTVIVDLDKCTAGVDIDCLTNYEKVVHDFLLYAYWQIEGKKEED